MTDFYDRVAAASGVSRATVTKVLKAAAFAVSTNDRTQLPSAVAEKVLDNGFDFNYRLRCDKIFVGGSDHAGVVEEVARRCNNHYPLVNALRGYVLLGTGSKVMISNKVNENARIALASAGET